jgi:hypothetical protein
MRLNKSIIIHKGKSQMEHMDTITSTRQWWYEARKSLDVFFDLINAPLYDVSYNESNNIVKNLKRAYQNIQRNTGGNVDDDLYTFVTQALLNLWLAYDELYGGNKSTAKTYASVARSSAIRLQDGLVSYGIVEIFGMKNYA